ncbi:DUF5132 domain-containing protein [Paenibacillus sp. RC67]|uniref:DUF5132 domain-containing protein n=1 Tax=Paenibacillus sp. RC67 TaxID=3039392 RepID=UPI0024AE0F27|nr:DUF5132 domain-containing protein [Paenibacillus sp. RC67]
MNQRNIEKVIIGAALSLAVSALIPIAKSALRPLAGSGAQGGAGLLQRTRSMFQIAREEVEDIIAEAQFERMKKQLDKEIAMLDDQDK